MASTSIRQAHGSGCTRRAGRLTPFQLLHDTRVDAVKDARNGDEYRRPQRSNVVHQQLDVAAA